MTTVSRRSLFARLFGAAGACAAASALPATARANAPRRLTISMADREAFAERLSAVIQQTIQEHHEDWVRRGIVQPARGTTPSL